MVDDGGVLVDESMGGRFTEVDGQLKEQR
jgi:hypothetical protein